MAAGALASLCSCMFGPTRAPQLYGAVKASVFVWASELNNRAIRGFAHSADFSQEPRVERLFFGLGGGKDTSA